MKLKRHYIFETNRTKAFRYTRNALFAVLVLIFIHILAIIVIMIGSQREMEKSNEFFYKQDPDLIAVYTGDKGRLPLAVELSEKHPQSKVLISGVYERNTVLSLLTKLKKSHEFDDSLFEIDYTARNTVENVLSTLRYLERQRGVQNIMIISNDYHLVRIKLILATLTPSNRNYRFFFTGVKTDYSKFRNIKVAFKELYKIVRTLGFLMFWESDLKDAEYEDVN